VIYKYSIVADSIKGNIYSGRYKPGEKLPSILTLSKELSYNTDTIVKAYKLLEAEHLIYASPKSGYYVVKSSTIVDNSNRIVDMVTIRIPDYINPYKDFCHCMEKAILLSEKMLFEYSSPQGKPELITALAKYLLNFHIFTKPQNIFITNGAQQALYILAAIPFPNNRTKVLVEQPTYSVMLQALKCNHTQVVGIERTQNGIDLNELESIFKKGDIKFFYTMPRYHNPTGFSYNFVQKKEIIRLAEQYEVYIVEDDYLADLEINTKADPMYVIGEKELIIYIRSFSKTMLPGLRLGMTILPQKLQEDFLTYKKSMDLNSPILTQGALEIYLQSSMYKFHKQRIKKYYKEKMAVLRDVCEQELEDRLQFDIPITGIFANLVTPGVSADVLVNRLAKYEVFLSSTNNCYLEGFHHTQSIRLCVCNSTDDEIRKVVKIIKQELK